MSNTCILCEKDNQVLNDEGYCLTCAMEVWDNDPDSAWDEEE